MVLDPAVVNVHQTWFPGWSVALTSTSRWQMSVLRQSRRLRSTSTPFIVRAVSIRIRGFTVSHSTTVLGKTIPA